MNKEGRSSRSLTDHAQQEDDIMTISSDDEITSGDQVNYQSRLGNGQPHMLKVTSSGETTKDDHIVSNMDDGSTTMPTQSLDVKSEDDSLTTLVGVQIPEGDCQSETQLVNSATQTDSPGQDYTIHSLKLRISYSVVSAIDMGSTGSFLHLANPDIRVPDTSTSTGSGSTESTNHWKLGTLLPSLFAWSVRHRFDQDRTRLLVGRNCNPDISQDSFLLILLPPVRRRLYRMRSLFPREPSGRLHLDNQHNRHIQHAQSLNALRYSEAEDHKETILGNLSSSSSSSSSSATDTEDSQPDDDSSTSHSQNNDDDTPSGEEPSSEDEK